MTRRNFSLFALSIPAAAQDWPQWRGPNRDGSAPAAAEPSAWPAQLRQVLKATVGEGHSSPVVGADRVVMGTDYPMAMGDFEPVRKIDSMNLKDEERSQILGANAARALNL